MKSLPYIDEAVAQRFFSKIDVKGPDDCWLWTASCDTKGHGQLGIAGSLFRAHRIAFALGNGADPSPLEIDHRCHNRRCCNPAHLRLATSKQNAENHQGARRDSRSGVRGVHWDVRHSKWRAQITHYGRRIDLGSFADLAEAEAAVVAARIRLFTHNDKDRRSA